MAKINKAQVVAAMAAMATAAIQPPRAVKPATVTKDSLLSEFNAALGSVKAAHAAMGEAAKVASAARGGFKAIVAKMKESGLFSDSELIALCKAAVKAEQISESGASRALTSVGIKQRAAGAGRPPKGGKGGNDGDEDGEDGEPEIIPAPETTVPLTAAGLASLCIAKFGKEKALQLLSEAYHTAKATAV